MPQEENINQAKKLITLEKDPKLGIFTELQELNSLLQNVISSIKASKSTDITVNNPEDLKTDLTPLEANFESLTVSLERVISSIKEIQSPDLKGIENLLIRISKKEFKQDKIDLSELSSISDLLSNILDVVATPKEKAEELKPSLDSISHILDVLNSNVTLLETQDFDYERLAEIIKKNLNINFSAPPAVQLKSPDDTLIEPATEEKQDKQITLSEISDWGFRQTVGNDVDYDFDRIEIINRFNLGGANPTVDPAVTDIEPEIISEASNPLVDPKADIQFSISSSDNTDSQLTVVQLYKNDGSLVTDFVTVGGHTPVDLNSTGRFSVGGVPISGVGLSGDLYIYPKGTAVTNGIPDDPLDVRMKIPKARQSGTNPIFYVPDDEIAYFEWWTGFSQSESKGRPLIGFLPVGDDRFSFFPRFPVGSGQFENNKKYGFRLFGGTWMYLAGDTETVNADMAIEINLIRYKILPLEPIE